MPPDEYRFSKALLERLTGLRLFFVLVKNTASYVYYDIARDLLGEGLALTVADNQNNKQIVRSKKDTINLLLLKDKPLFEDALEIEELDKSQASALYKQYALQFEKDFPKNQNADPTSSTTIVKQSIEAIFPTLGQEKKDSLLETILETCLEKIMMPETAPQKTRALAVHYLDQHIQNSAGFLWTKSTHLFSCYDSENGLPVFPVRFVQESVGRNYTIKTEEKETISASCEMVINQIQIHGKNIKDEEHPLIFTTQYKFSGEEASLGQVSISTNSNNPDFKKFFLLFQEYLEIIKLTKDKETTEEAKNKIIQRIYRLIANTYDWLGDETELDTDWINEILEYANIPLNSIVAEKIEAAAPIVKAYNLLNELDEWATEEQLQAAEKAWKTYNENKNRYSQYLDSIKNDKKNNIKKAFSSYIGDLDKNFHEKPNKLTIQLKELKSSHKNKAYINNKLYHENFAKDVINTLLGKEYSDRVDSDSENINPTLFDDEPDFGLLYKKDALLTFSHNKTNTIITGHTIVGCRLAEIIQLYADLYNQYTPQEKEQADGTLNQINSQKEQADGTLNQINSQDEILSKLIRRLYPNLSPIQHDLYKAEQKLILLAIERGQVNDNSLNIDVENFFISKLLDQIEEFFATENTNQYYDPTLMSEHLAQFDKIQKLIKNIKINNNKIKSKIESIKNNIEKNIIKLIKTLEKFNDVLNPEETLNILMASIPQEKYRTLFDEKILQKKDTIITCYRNFKDKLKIINEEYNKFQSTLAGQGNHPVEEYHEFGEERHLKQEYVQKKFTGNLSEYAKTLYSGFFNIYYDIQQLIADDNSTLKPFFNGINATLSNAFQKEAPLLDGLSRARVQLIGEGSDATNDLASNLRTLEILRDNIQDKLNDRAKSQLKILINSCKAEMAIRDAAQQLQHNITDEETHHHDTNSANLYKLLCLKDMQDQKENISVFRMLAHLSSPDEKYADNLNNVTQNIKNAKRALEVIRNYRETLSNKLDELENSPIKETINDNIKEHLVKSETEAQELVALYELKLAIYQTPHALENTDDQEEFQVVVHEPQASAALLELLTTDTFAEGRLAELEDKIPVINELKKLENQITVLRQHTKNNTENNNWLIVENGIKEKTVLISATLAQYQQNFVNKLTAKQSTLITEYARRAEGLAKGLDSTPKAIITSEVSRAVKEVASKSLTSSFNRLLGHNNANRLTPFEKDEKNTNTLAVILSENIHKDNFQKSQHQNKTEFNLLLKFTEKAKKLENEKVNNNTKTKHYNATKNLIYLSYSAHLCIHTYFNNIKSKITASEQLEENHRQDPLYITVTKNLDILCKQSQENIDALLTKQVTILTERAIEIKKEGGYNPTVAQIREAEACLDAADDLANTRARAIKDARKNPKKDAVYDNSKKEIKNARDYLRLEAKASRWTRFKYSAKKGWGFVKKHWKKIALASLACAAIGVASFFFPPAALALKFVASHIIGSSIASSYTMATVMTTGGVLGCAGGAALSTLGTLSASALKNQSLLSEKADAVAETNRTLISTNPGETLADAVAETNRTLISTNPGETLQEYAYTNSGGKFIVVNPASNTRDINKILNATGNRHMNDAEAAAAGNPDNNKQEAGPIATRGPSENFTKTEEGVLEGTRRAEDASSSFNQGSSTHFTSHTTKGAAGKNDLAVKALPTSALLTRGEAIYF